MTEIPEIGLTDEEWAYLAQQSNDRCPGCRHLILFHDPDLGFCFLETCGCVI